MMTVVGTGLDDGTTRPASAYNKTLHVNKLITLQCYKVYILIHSSLTNYYYILYLIFVQRQVINISNKNLYK